MKTLKMTSRDIARHTGKQHDNVRRDIKRMLERLSLKVEEKSEPSGKGRPTKVYYLDEDLTMTLVAGYDAKLRYTIVQEGGVLKETSKQSSGL